MAKLKNKLKKSPVPKAKKKYKTERQDRRTYDRAHRSDRTF